MLTLLWRCVIFIFLGTPIFIKMLDSQDKFGSQEMKSGDILDRLIWKTTHDQVGDGSAYRTAIVERKELRFLPRVVLNHRKKLMALGVLAGLSGGAKAVEALWPESTEQAIENKADDVNVASVRFQVHSQICGKEVEDCYVDVGDGLSKIPTK